MEPKRACDRSKEILEDIKKMERAIPMPEEEDAE